MGVDGQGGRVEGGSGGLINPFRAESFDIDSTRDADEVLAGIDARSQAASYWWGWFTGSGVARRGRGNERLLAVRHWFEDGTRPIAFVEVSPAGEGSRVSVTLRPSTYDFAAGAIGWLCTLVYVLTIPPGLWHVPILVFVAAAVLWDARRSYVSRERLRGLIEDAAR